jgi:outer membrane lipoprotein-sorting protein
MNSFTAPKRPVCRWESRPSYTALNSYSDEGILTSSGTGYMAKHARFQTRFVRPHKFRFQVMQATYGNEWDKDVVWSDGKKTWWYNGMSGGSEERGSGNALSTPSVTAGDAATLVPALLMPAEFGGGEFDTSSGGIALAGEERVSGTDCYVISLNNPEGTDLKLWIEKSSYLTLRAFDRTSESTITYQPKCNVKIADSEFKFTPPK